MNGIIRRRVAALLEVLGVYLTGAFVNDRLADFLIAKQVISSTNPFSLLTADASNHTLLVASHQLFVILILLYASYFLLIVALTWWHGHRGPSVYGLTRAGFSPRTLLLCAIATAALTQWPVLVHSLIDALHPLGAMAPWRQAFFDMSWRRWQFWLFAGILSYALIPVLEELLFRGYYQRRLAEDWGDGPAILGTACFFTFAHKQYLIANAYNVTMILSLLCMAIGLGLVFAWTRSLFPSMVAHALINIPMTPPYQGALVFIFAVIFFFYWRTGLSVTRQIFANTRVAVCVIPIAVQTTYVVAAARLTAMTWIAIGLLFIAILLEVRDRHPDQGKIVTTA